MWHSKYKYYKYHDLLCSMKLRDTDDDSQYANLGKFRITQ